MSEIKFRKEILNFVLYHKLYILKIVAERVIETKNIVEINTKSKLLIFLFSKIKFRDDEFLFGLVKTSKIIMPSQLK